MRSTSCSFFTANGIFFITIAVGINSSSGSLLKLSARSCCPPRGDGPIPPNAPVAESWCWSSQVCGHQLVLARASNGEKKVELTYCWQITSPSSWRCFHSTSCCEIGKVVVDCEGTGIPCLSRWKVVAAICSCLNRRIHPVKPIGIISQCVIIIRSIQVVLYHTICIKMS